MTNKNKKKLIENKYVIARTCGRLIGLEVDCVIGITDKGNIFKIPQLTRPILGLGKYSSKVLAVVDTGSFCGLKRSEKHLITKWIITNTYNGLAALAVDEVYGIKNVLIKGKISRKNNVINNFEFNNNTGDIINLDTVLPKVDKIIREKNLTKTDDQKFNIDLENEEKTFFCFNKNGISNAIEMSNVISVHSMNECDKPLVLINRDIVLGNINNQLIPIFYNRNSSNLIILKFGDKIFGLACEKISGIKNINIKDIFLEENIDGQQKEVAFYNEILKDTKIINTEDLLEKKPIDNWMPNNLVLKNTMEKSYEDNFLFFKILNFNFGLPLEKIKRVEFFEKPKNIPNLKKGILGVSNLEQKTVLVVDFLDLLNIQQIHENKSNHKEIIFLDTEKGNIGLAVNEIIGINTINQNQLKESSNFDGMQTKILAKGKDKTFFPLIENFQNKLSEYLI